MATQYVADEYESESEEENESEPPNKEDWMYLADFLNKKLIGEESELNRGDNTYWQGQCKDYQNDLLNMPSWINIQKQSFQVAGNYKNFETEQALIKQLNNDQSKTFNIVKNHSAGTTSQLLLIVTGQAGCGKSFLIERLRNLLKFKCVVTAMFGIAAFNVNGKTLHSILKLPIRGKRIAQLKGVPLLEKFIRH